MVTKAKKTDIRDKNKQSGVVRDFYDFRNLMVGNYLKYSKISILLTW